MKIAVVGWYHKLNLGDELLQNAITRLFADCHLTFWGHTPDPQALRGFDHLIVGGGSVWPNALFDRYLATRQDLVTPFSLLGISARRRVAERVTRQVLEDAHVVVVRDAATRQQLYNEPKVQVGPDLAWLCPLEPQPRLPEGRVVGLSLRAWPRSPWSPKVIGQALGRWADEVFGLPLYYGDRRWEGQRARPDREVIEAAGVASAERIEPSWLHRARFVVAMRFHALVLAAQAGVPFVGFSYHPKIVAFCQELGLSRYCVPLADADALTRALRELEENEEALRHHLREQREPLVQRARLIYGAAREQILAASPRASSLLPRSRRPRAPEWVRRWLPFT